eukprot:7322077-Pyramimonas_sp.AAC.1
MEAIANHTGIVANIAFNVNPTWNSEITVDYSGFAESSGSTAGATYKHRYTYGVSVYAKVGGVIGYFDYFMCFTVVMTSITMLSLPTKIVTFVAVHCLGLCSVIYARER